ncbi:helix-turn-helix transcriptional regulator [Frondihabitans peucedani]|uniref:HTH araC/xylS-type domain-containing protein n=1 Tax=Frondihabitans peucedani TaxID=598626 RepID=A0ABP8E1V5_9MICO
MSGGPALPGREPSGPEPGAVELRRVGGTDLDEAVTRFHEEYAISRLRVRRTDVDFSWEHTSRGTPLITLRTSWFGGVIGGVTHDSDVLVVLWNSRGSSVVRGESGEVRISENEPILLPFLGPTAFEHHETAQNLLHLDRPLFNGIAAEFGALDQVLSDQGPRRLLQGHGPSWSRAVRALRSSVFSADRLSPVAEMVLAQTAATAILRHFYGVDGAVDAALGPRSRAGDRIREYLHAHPDLPTTTPDLAELIGMTPRAVQLIMRSETGLTPTGYLKMVRLREVRRGLQDRSPGESIADVANRWGFFHLGRFASAYRQRFGESPRDTRRR